MRIGTVVLAAALSFPSCAPHAPPRGAAEPPPSRRADRVAALDRLVDDAIARGWLRGGAVVAGWDGEVAFERGTGMADVARDVPLTPGTPVDGGSLAKPFTATALLLLQQRGALDLDEPVRRYLPEYPYDGTTLRHLITHTTGGLPDYDWFWERAGQGGVLTNAFVLETLARERPSLQHPVGTRFRYDDMGFYVAALVVERVGGIDFEEFLRRNLWQPAGMTATFARPARFSDWQGVRTLGYRPDADSLVVHDVWDGEGVVGGSNVYLSATDLFRWMSAFATAPALDPAALRAGLRPGRLADGTPTGLTVLSLYASPDGTAYQYSGHINAFHSVGYVDLDDRFAFAITSNTTLAPWLQNQLPRAIATVMRGGVANLDPPDAAPLDSAALVATFDVDGIGTVAFYEEHGQQRVRVGVGAAYPAYRVDDTTFYVPGLDVWLSTGDVVDGTAMKLNWDTVFERRTGRRRAGRQRVPRRCASIASV